MTIMYKENSTETHPAVLSIPDLRSSFKGQVIAPGDDGYDQARTVYTGGIDHHPAVIIRAANPADVSQAVLLARKTGLDLSIRSGGHSLVGHGVSDGGIMLDLSNMKDMQIDVEGRTAWAETGLTAGEYTKAVGEYDLATGFGDTATVGIGGITVGGGVGYLVRKYGLTIDQVLAAEVVTADGQIRQVDTKTHPDLFWAIRGGGGNFGVVTRFKFQLHKVDSVVGGMLILPADPDVITRFIAEAQNAPDELSIIANALTAPPMPFLPPEVHGKPIFMTSIAYAGDAKAGETAIAPFRALAKPIADMIRPMRYPELFAPDEGGFHPIAATRTFFVDAIDRPAAEAIVDHLRTSTATVAVVQIRVMGGAVARVPVDATAYAHRKSSILAYVAAMYQQSAEEATHKAWVSEMETALKSHYDGAYVNFIGNEGQERVRAAYPGSTWTRLAAVKERYDPTNLFRLNQNVLPENQAPRG